MTTLTLIREDAVPEGTSVEVVADGRIFAVFRLDNVVHVLDGLCAHAGGPLGKGTVSGGVVTCPWHGWQYDIRTGRHCLTPRICQASYPARIVDGHVVIEA